MCPSKGFSLTPLGYCIYIQLRAGGCKAWKTAAVHCDLLVCPVSSQPLVRSPWPFVESFKALLYHLKGCEQRQRVLRAANGV